MVRAVVGANWGDEGKGKITDMLAEDSDIIIRFQGGSNAGHTIINDYGKFALHLLPSGVFYNHTTSVIGNGVALNIPYLVEELESLTSRNVPMPKILVSDRAQILMPYHMLLDAYEEERLGGKSFGSTKSGIAPFYSDKYAKIGFQVSELFDEEGLKEKVYRVVETKNVLIEHLYHKEKLDPEEIYQTLLGYRDMIKPYVCDTSAFLHQALKENKRILLEGQLGSLKDPDFGIYPMVTSSSTLQVFLDTRSRMLLQLLRLIPVQLVPVNLYLRFLAKKLMNSESAAVTAANSALQQDVQDVWVGLMRLLQDTAAVYRVQQK